MAKLDSFSPRVCVWPARGECAPPLLPPAKRRRLALAAGSSESLLGPGSPGPVTLVFARADAARRPGRGAPRATPRGSAFLPGPWDPESRRPGDPEKFAGAARRPGPGISIAAPAPSPVRRHGDCWKLVAENRPSAKQNIMSAVGVTSAGRGTGGQEREPEAEADNKGPSAKRIEEFAGASLLLCESRTVLLPRGAAASNFSPAATPFLSPPRGLSPTPPLSSSHSSHSRSEANRTGRLPPPRATGSPT